MPPSLDSVLSNIIVETSRMEILEKEWQNGRCVSWEVSNKYLERRSLDEKWDGNQGLQTLNQSRSKERMIERSSRNEIRDQALDARITSFFLLPRTQKENLQFSNSLLCIDGDVRDYRETTEPQTSILVFLGLSHEVRRSKTNGRAVRKMERRTTGK
jgi:hypothetical protein